MENVNWENIYSGKETKLVGTNANKRFEYVLNYFFNNDKKENIVDIGSGFADFPKLLNEKTTNKLITACDFSFQAKEVSNYKPYVVCKANKTFFNNKEFPKNF